VLFPRFHPVSGPGPALEYRITAGSGPAYLVQPDSSEAVFNRTCPSMLAANGILSLTGVNGLLFLFNACCNLL